MEDLVQFSAGLKRRNAAAGACISAILSAEAGEGSVIEQNIRSYILARFALDGDVAEDDLSALARMSLRRLDELKRSGLDKNDVSPGCNGVSTESAKKALLLVSLQKALGIRLDAMQAAYIETVPQLAAAVAAELGKAAKTN